MLRWSDQKNSIILSFGTIYVTDYIVKFGTIYFFYLPV